jgi:hypothetical protein
MSNSNSKSGTPIGIHKISKGSSMQDSQENTPLSQILQTREAKQALNKILPDILGAFTKDTRSSKFMMKHLGNYLGKILTQSNDAIGMEDLKQLFGNKDFTGDFARPLPDMINSVLEVNNILMQIVEELPSEEKTKILEDLFSKISKGQTGTFITRCCRAINDIHKSDPVFFTKNMGPGFKKWVESVDFGEIRELFDTSAEDGRKFIAMVNDTMWRYPTKMIMSLSFLPSLLNLIMDTADLSVAKFNELPPDMLSDVIISFVREINDDTIAENINQVSELIRKIHTGSALIGDPGTPQLEKTISGMIENIMKKTDPVTFWKAKIALTQTWASVEEAIVKATFETPAFKNLNMVKGPEISNIRIKSLNYRLGAWESLADEEMAKSMTQHLLAYDVQEMAEVANNLFRIINRLGDENPVVFRQIAGKFVNAIDDYELSETVKHLSNGANKEIEPLARAVVPGLVSWVCGVIKPCDDEYENEAAKARESLQSLFATQEV